MSWNPFSWLSKSATEPVDFKQIATNANYNLKRNDTQFEQNQRQKIKQMFKEASDMGSDEIEFTTKIHPNIVKDLTSVGYTIKDGMSHGEHRVGGNVVEFRDIPCKIIKLPPDST